MEGVGMLQPGPSDAQVHELRLDPGAHVAQDVLHLAEEGKNSAVMIRGRGGQP